MLEAIKQQLTASGKNYIIIVYGSKARVAIRALQPTRICGGGEQILVLLER